jgi:hypothetical protein
VSEQEPSPEQSPHPTPAAGEGVTEGGYSYTVVGDTAEADRPPVEEPERVDRARGRSLGVVAAAVVVLLAVGAGAFFAGRMLRDDDGGDRATANVGSVINAFSQGGEGATVHRYEGELPPGYPDDVPAYPGAELIASIVQISGPSAGYLAVYDTADDREDVAAYFTENFDEDPWQVDAGRDTRDSALQQFSKIDDPDVTGLVLSASSKDDDVTTIVVSVQVTGGAETPDEDFEPGVTKALPNGFPQDVPQYPEAIIIESAFQNQPRANSFIISFITRDDVTSVLDFFRDQFEEKGWTVTDSDASESPLEDAEALDFGNASGEEEEITGALVAGEFPDDNNYTEVDLTVTVTRE